MEGERSTPSPQQSAPQTSPTTDTSSPNLDSDDPIATTPSTTDPAPDPSSEEPAGDISPYTSARPPATDDDEAGASATSNGIRKATSPRFGVRVVHRQGTEPMSLNPVAGEQNEYSTADVSDRLAQADWEGPLLVEVQFDLVPSAAAPSDEDDPQFTMTSYLTADQLVGESTGASDATVAGLAAQAVVADSGADSKFGLLAIMLAALVLLAGAAAFAVWFFAVRQRNDAAVPVDTTLTPDQPGFVPPLFVQRMPADPTEGAALPVAAGTATLTALAFRGRVDARTQLFSLTDVSSVNGVSAWAPGGSEALEKWWGGPIGAEGVMMGGWSEKIPNAGEDSTPLALATPGMGSTLIAVADGLGGAGARTVSTETGEATAARVASRLALDELAAWWVQTHDAEQPDYLDLKRSIAGILRHQLRDQVDAGVVGTLVREYPTTLAAATVVRSRRKSRVRVIWAGDSRVYLLSQDGFQLLTTDQVSGDADELAQMYADPQMTNMISADRPFNLQVAETIVGEPFLLLAATDGCFGYLPSPAHLDAVLMEELVNSASEDEWARRLTHRFNGVAGDDTSFAALLIGSTFEKFSKGMRPRAEQVNRDLVGPVQAAPAGDGRRQAIDLVWRGYRDKFVARRAQMPVSSVEGE